MARRTAAAVSGRCTSFPLQQSPRKPVTLRGGIGAITAFGPAIIHPIRGIRRKPARQKIRSSRKRR